MSFPFLVLSTDCVGNAQVGSESCALQACDSVWFHLARNVPICQLVLWKENWLVGYLRDWTPSPVIKWADGHCFFDLELLRLNSPWWGTVGHTPYLYRSLSLTYEENNGKLCQGGQILLNTFVLHIWPPCGQLQLVYWPSVTVVVSVMTSDSLFSAGVPSELPNEGVPRITWLWLTLLVVLMMSDNSESST